jgi:hypothetical protein
MELRRKNLHSWLLLFEQNIVLFITCSKDLLIIVHIICDFVTTLHLGRRDHRESGRSSKVSLRLDKPYHSMPTIAAASGLVTKVLNLPCGRPTPNWLLRWSGRDWPPTEHRVGQMMGSSEPPWFGYYFTASRTRYHNLLSNVLVYSLKRCEWWY